MESLWDSAAFFFADVIACLDLFALDSFYTAG